MLSLHDLGMHLGARVLFDNVSLNLNRGSRYGIVGANGAGKTTLLRLLSGEDTPSFGAVTIAKGAKIGWLKQDQFLYDDEAILSVVLRGHHQLWKALEEKQRLLNKETFTDNDGYRLATLEETIASCDGYVAEGKAQALLEGLGIPEDYHFKPLKCLSGGYKLRVLLARTLFDTPDILLLDEPTNFLDIVSIGWLESYLSQQFDGLLVAVSHDHDFLNHVCDHILDIDYGEIRLYTGNYNRFIELKQLVDEQKQQERKHLQRQYDKTRSFIDRFKCTPTRARQCQSREKMLEKMEWPDTQVSSRISPEIDFTMSRPSGQRVLQVRKLTKQMGSKQLFQGIDIDVHRGERIAILGPNGSGKSTLVKLLMSLLPPDQGEVDWGHAAEFSYFAQESHEVIHGSQDVFSWLYNEMPEAGEMRVRQMLGRALFSRDDAFKPLTSLSGGEMARLLLARLMLQQRNVLILDEPTNHLDLEARTALAEALKAYPGTVICVSHDRYFIEAIATRILTLSRGVLDDFSGPYKDFLAVGGDDYLHRA